VIALGGKRVNLLIPRAATIRNQQVASLILAGGSIFSMSYRSSKLFCPSKTHPLTAIPDSLSRLRNLKSLTVAENRITATPDSLFTLPSLQSIKLSGNQITAIPDSLSGLTSLPSKSLRPLPQAGRPPDHGAVLRGQIGLISSPAGRARSCEILILSRASGRRRSLVMRPSG